MAFNIYDTHTLLMAVESLSPVSSFLRDRYFPTNEATDVFSTTDVLVEYKDGNKKLAPFVAPRKGGVTILRKGYTVDRYTPPRIAPKRALTIDDLTRKGFGEALFSKLTPAERQTALLLKDFDEMGESITRREEAMAAETLLTNGCIMKHIADDASEGEDIGFNHNATYEGSNRIHFQGFKTAQSGGKDVGLVGSKYNSNYNDGTKYFNINHWGYYNYGGWSASDLRYDVLGSTNVAPSNYGEVKASGATGSNATNTCATNPVAGTLMAALPSDLRAVLKPITKYTDNVGGGTGSVQSNVTATTDYLPLLSMKEVFGSTNGYANSYEGNCQAQYTYYANGNSKVKYKHSDVNTAAWWWLRSPYCDYTSIFCAVWSSGSHTSNTADISAALAPAFAV